MTHVIATSIDLCMILLTFSSILSIARFAVFSMSRRMVTLAVASGINTVLIHVFIRWSMLIAERRPIRYERSGSFLAVSWLAAMSIALLRISEALQTVLDYSRVQSRFNIYFSHVCKQEI